MAKRKLFISFDVHDGVPQVHARTKDRGMWLVVMSAENFDERIELEMENDIPCDLPTLQPLLMEKLTEIIGELSPVVDASFNVYRKVF